MDHEPSARTSPRLSINKLSEYLVCTPIRRRRILIDAKYPQKSIVTRFRDFYDVGPMFCASEPLNEDIIHQTIQKLRAGPFKNEWERENAKLNEDLLRGLAEIGDHFDLEAFHRSVTGDTKQSTMISGVEVSVRPEVLLRKKTGNGNVSGALKLYATKTYPLNAEAGACATTILTHFLQEAYPEADIDFRHCLLFDIPSAQLHIAPSSYKKRKKDIFAACEEIKDRWDKITPQ